MDLLGILERHRPVASLVILVIITMSGACSNSSAMPSEPSVVEYEDSSGGLSLKGTIEVDGSSTVYPVSEAVAEEFGKLHSGVRVNVGVSGTGGGFKRFVVGETDISNASRLLKEKESELAIENGVTYVHLRVAMDGLSVIVNPDNDFVHCLTTEQLKAIWEPESKINNWNQVDSSWPDKQIELYGPDADSGTFDYFTEEIVGESQASRWDYTPSADDNVLIQGISGDRNALGYFGYAYYVENADKLKIVAVDSGEGCVKPTSETIENGTYSPLSRPLFIYVNVNKLSKPQVKEFVRFYMENAGQLSGEVGYIGLSQQEYEDNLTKIE